VVINPLVVDLSHHNDVVDFSKVKAAGIAGIIHKATEAIGFVDNAYAVRRGHAVNVCCGAHIISCGRFRSPHAAGVRRRVIEDEGVSGFTRRLKRQR
jgi:Glycosyl hydrolases family 25